jgi:hypothetical protein
MLMDEKVTPEMIKAYQEQLLKQAAQNKLLLK